MKVTDNWYNSYRYGENDNSISQSKAVVEIAGIWLDKSDITYIFSGRLNDSIINFGQVLIKDRFPSIGGFQLVIHSRTLTFKPEKEFKQVLNCDDAHWVCATNIDCYQNLVKVCDSWSTGDVTTDTKEAIANLPHSIIVIKEYIFSFLKCNNKRMVQIVGYMHWHMLIH